MNTVGATHLFHHIHHSDDGHIVHHCGIPHKGENYLVQHCPCGKHSILPKVRIAKRHSVSDVYCWISYTEACPYGGWHLEGATVTRIFTGWVVWAIVKLQRKLKMGGFGYSDKQLEQMALKAQLEEEERAKKQEEINHKREISYLKRKSRFEELYAKFGTEDEQRREYERLKREFLR